MEVSIFLLLGFSGDNIIPCNSLSPPLRLTQSAPTSLLKKCLSTVM